MTTDAPDDALPAEAPSQDTKAGGPTVCPECGGTGSVGPERCEPCHGTGHIEEAVVPGR